MAGVSVIFSPRGSSQQVLQSYAGLRRPCITGELFDVLVRTPGAEGATDVGMDAKFRDVISLILTLAFTQFVDWCDRPPLLFTILFVLFGMFCPQHRVVSSGCPALRRARCLRWRGGA